MAIATPSRQGQRQSRQQPLARSRPVRWEPFQELEQLNEQVARLMEGVFQPVGTGDGTTWVPLADIEETDDAWIIEAELPSVDRKDVNVELNESELVITGEIKEKERAGVLRRRTRRVGQFEYRVTLPGRPDPENIEAKLHDGVLTVRVPKSSTDQRRRVEVKEG
jgi:HSP20 family protein